MTEWKNGLPVVSRTEHDELLSRGRIVEGWVRRKDGSSLSVEYLGAIATMFNRRNVDKGVPVWHGPLSTAYKSKDRNEGDSPRIALPPGSDFGLMRSSRRSAAFGEADVAMFAPMDTGGKHATDVFVNVATGSHVHELFVDAPPSKDQRSLPPAADVERSRSPSSPSLASLRSKKSQSSFSLYSATSMQFLVLIGHGVAPTRSPQPKGECIRVDPQQWLPGTIALVSKADGPGDQIYSTVMVVAECKEEDGAVRVSDREGRVRVFDGVRFDSVEPERLTKLEVPTSFGPRLLSNAGASTAPSRLLPPKDADKAHWSWLTVRGLAEAGTRELEVPQGVVGHLVGKRGATIRKIEDHFGVIVGIMDGCTGTAKVTVVGPETRLDGVGKLIQCLAKGARSLISRLIEKCLPPD